MCTRAKLINNYRIDQKIFQEYLKCTPAKLGMWLGTKEFVILTKEFFALNDFVGEHVFTHATHNCGMGIYHPWSHCFELKKVEFIGTDERVPDISWERYLAKNNHKPIYQWYKGAWRELSSGMILEIWQSVGLWLGEGYYFPMYDIDNGMKTIRGDFEIVNCGWKKGMQKYRQWSKSPYLEYVGFIATDAEKIDPSWEQYLAKEGHKPIYKWDGDAWQEVLSGFSQK